jgi:nucleoside-diphosphate-sugar epimerase
MGEVMAATKVLVTGGSGFIAKHCIAELQRRDFSVQATLRNLDRQDEVRRGIDHAGGNGEDVTFFKADLLHDDGWDEAMQGCTYVQHVASPFPLDNPADPQEVIRPAREGALRALRTATRAGVKRVVLTSSIVAVTLPWPEASLGHVFTEADWSNPERPDVTAYVISKTLAEQAAWDFVKGEMKAPELTVINPAFVLGPAADGDISTSHAVLRLMAQGKYLAAPKVGFPISDVRDVAITHALAMTNPKAAGERFLTANGFLRLYEIGQILAQALPDLKSKVPKFEASNFTIRIVALFDKRLKPVLADLGHPRYVSNAKAHTILEQSFRSAEEAAKSAASSLRALHVI